MTATDRNLRDGDASLVRDCAIRHIERSFRAVVDGRRAARALAEWTKRFELSEAEFHLLWRLRSAAEVGFDQTMLTNELALSPAQISATVERLRARGWICQQTAAGDRRRHLWQLSSAGRDQLDRMLSAAAYLRCEPAPANERASSDASKREAAA